MMTGGVAKNPGVVRALSEKLGTKIIRAPGTPDRRCPGGGSHRRDQARPSAGIKQAAETGLLDTRALSPQGPCAVLPDRFSAIHLPPPIAAKYRLMTGIYDKMRRTGADCAWWCAWTSNPVSGMTSVSGGFDSHTLPPNYWGTWGSGFIH